MVQDQIMLLIAREGGYVNDSDDHGGPTNMGVTQGALSEFRGYPVSIADVQALTKAEATQLYTQKYWLAPGFDKIHQSDIIADMLLDASAHHGAAGAVMLLQRALRVKPDGELGPVTLAAANAMNGPMLAAALMGARVSKLGRIIERNHTQAKYAAGWFNRMQALILMIPRA